MNVTLEFITPDAENFIGQMAGICYGRETEREANVKRAVQVAQKGHLACLRFSHAVFNIKGISRACSHQLVRSKHLDFLQRSQRYCNEEEASVVVPPSLTDEEAGIFWDTINACRDAYATLRDMGVKKEDARFVLPEATETELNVVGNLQSWMDFIKLRADKHAQWEVRSVAIEVNNILAQHCPNLFKKMEMF